MSTLRSEGREGGMSLVELMVAIALGAILMAGAITLFVNNRDTYNVTTEMSRMQESARFALEAMLRDLRMTGYFGCARDPDRVTDGVSGGNGELWDPAFAIEGLVGLAWQPSGRPANLATLVANTDAVTLRYLAGSSADDSASGNPDFAVVGGDTLGVVVDDASAFQPGLPVGVGDCGSTDVFLLDSIVGQRLDAAAPLSRTYDPQGNPMVAPYVGVRYYVANTAAGNPSLFRQTIVAGAGGLEEAPEELVEGVENLRLLFGVDANGNGAPDEYVTAAGIGADEDLWRQVVTVRIAMLVRTVDEYGRADDVDIQTYDLNGAVLGPFEDRRRRRVFTTTAVLRNHL